MFWEAEYCQGTRDSSRRRKEGDFSVMKTMSCLFPQAKNKLNIYDEGKELGGLWYRSMWNNMLPNLNIYINNSSIMYAGFRLIKETRKWTIITAESIAGCGESLLLGRDCVQFYMCLLPNTMVPDPVRHYQPIRKDDIIWTSSLCSSLTPVGPEFDCGSMKCFQLCTTLSPELKPWIHYQREWVNS